MLISLKPGSPSSPVISEGDPGNLFFTLVIDYTSVRFFRKYGLIGVCLVKSGVGSGCFLIKKPGSG